MNDEPRVGEWWWLDIPSNLPFGSCSGEVYVTDRVDDYFAVTNGARSLIVRRVNLLHQIDDPRLLPRLIRWVKGWFR